MLILLFLSLFAQQDKLTANYEAALKESQAEPQNVEKLIWVGRRLGYLGRFDEAIDVYTKGIAIEPNNAKLYRHRGHRYISTRRFDSAVKDFEKAASLIQGKPDEVEPDGQPNKLNQPRSTLQFNIYYHLGLAYYLQGNFPKALAAYQQCMKRSTSNHDSLVATSDWLYMTLRRMNRKADAAKVLEPIQESMDIIENDSYHKRLLMYKGLLKPEELAGQDDLSIATQGYGVGNWYLYNGDKAKAREVFEKVVAGKQKAAFGFIAAEVELARMK